MVSVQCKTAPLSPKEQTGPTFSTECPSQFSTELKYLSSLLPSLVISISHSTAIISKKADTTLLIPSFILDNIKTVAAYAKEIRGHRL